MCSGSGEITLSYESNKQAVRDFLGEVVELPTLFEALLICPDCLWVGCLVIAGGGYECFHCGKTYRATIVLTDQGKAALALFLLAITILVEVAWRRRGGRL